MHRAGGASRREGPAEGLLDLGRSGGAADRGEDDAPGLEGTELAQDRRDEGTCVPGVQEPRLSSGLHERGLPARVPEVHAEHRPRGHAQS